MSSLIKLWIEKHPGKAETAVFGYIRDIFTKAAIRSVLIRLNALELLKSLYKMTQKTVLTRGNI